MTYVVLICTTDEIRIFIFINGHALPFECDSPLTPALRAPRALFCSPYKRKKEEKKRKKKKKTDDFASLSSSEAWAPESVQCMTYHRLSSDELRPKSDMFFSSVFSVVFSWTMISLHSNQHKLIIRTHFCFTGSCLKRAHFYYNSSSVSPILSYLITRSKIKIKVRS